MMFKPQQTSLQEALSLIRSMEHDCEAFYRCLAGEAQDASQDRPDGAETEAACQLLFDRLSEAADILSGPLEGLREELPHAFYAEMVQNIQAALYDTAELINGDQELKAAFCLHFRLFPFLQELWEEVYFWGTVYPDPSRMEHYYREEFVPHHAAPSQQRYPYRFSIFIPVYNKLEYTKLCLESILKNTDLKKHACEFILLDDGSTDGTREYLDSLGIEKVIHLPVNVKTLIFSLGLRVCQGEYLVFVNNDTIVTKGWLENLLLCMESDENIISATPCTPNTSNHQDDAEGRYSYTSYEKLYAHENRSDPLLWEERTRIMPVIAMYRTALLNRIGFADRLFYTMEFWDDDFSLRARRAGFRQILCKDTYCHHFGSVTGKDGWEKGNTLKAGEKLFRKKHGFDPYIEDFCYDSQYLDFVRETQLPESGSLSLLAIDSCLGDTLRTAGSYLKQHGRSFSCSALLTGAASASEASARSVTEECKKELSLLCGSSVLEADLDGLEKEWKEESLDFIFVMRPLETYDHYPLLLQAAARKLKKGGLLLFCLTNLYYRPLLEGFLQLSFPADVECVRYLSYDVLRSRLSQQFEQINCVAEMDQQLLPGLEEFLSAHVRTDDPAVAQLLLPSQYLKVCCRK